jgi:GT2 family glycosyltransferase
LRKDALSALVAAYQRHSAAIFGSLVLRCESPDTVAFAGGLEIEDGVVDVTSVYNRYKGLDLATVRHLVRERQVSDLHGCSWLIPLDVIRKYGFMDESYFLYAEETAYSYYLRTKGIPSIIVPESVVVHDASASFAGCSDMENIQRYYRHRNWERLRRQYLNVSRRTIIREHGGKQHLFKFFVSYCLSSGARRKQLAAKFYTYLAAIHAVLGVKGKTFRPEDYFTAPR